MNKLYYDSYAIIEYVNGNLKYDKYFKDYEGITTLYNVMEVYYAILREENEFKAKEVLEMLKSIVIYPSFEDIEEAMKFRLIHKLKRFSYADCLGYILAKKRNIKFLTGDKGFMGIPNVIFVN